MNECNRATLQSWLSGLEAAGRSTKQIRSILTQMFDLAVRDGALLINPMASIDKSKRKPKVTRKLNVEHGRLLRSLVTPDATRRSSTSRRPNPDLAEVVDFSLGTGCRIGEVLAVRWCDVHLDAVIPYVVVCGTMIEARNGLPYHRHPARKNDDRDLDALLAGRADGDEPDLILFLPTHVVEVPQRRRARIVAKGRIPRSEEPVFASSRGTWLHASNVRTRLRKATKETAIDGIHPHALRKMVATLVERNHGMEAARLQMGHSDPSVTGQVYVQDSMVGPDVRETLCQFFDPNWQPTERVVVPRLRHAQ